MAKTTMTSETAIDVQQQTQTTSKKEDDDDAKGR